MYLGSTPGSASIFYFLPGLIPIFLKQTVQSAPSSSTTCPGGETGRHKGLKIPRLNGRAGSIPAPGTILKTITYDEFIRVVFLRKSYEKYNVDTM